jgi:anaphase-promoting complex subunit 10
MISIVDRLDTVDFKELGSEAIFTISSAKPGNGVEQLRDNNLESFWQSDGAFPHCVNIQFLKKVYISKLCIYMDYSLDESYTAKKICVSSGSSVHDLMDLVTIELSEPIGWVVIELQDPVTEAEVEENKIHRTHHLQLKVLSMHQNGKDTHIRQLKIFGPRESPRVMGNLSYDDFKTLQMQQFAVIR